MPLCLMYVKKQYEVQYPPCTSFYDFLMQATGHRFLRNTKDLYSRTYYTNPWEHKLHFFLDFLLYFIQHKHMYITWFFRTQYVPCKSPIILVFQGWFVTSSDRERHFWNGPFSAFLKISMAHFLSFVVKLLHFNEPFSALKSPGPMVPAFPDHCTSFKVSNATRTLK